MAPQSIHLRCNEQILITKPDKGSGVVILNKSDYIKKMGSILDDKTKVLNVGGVDLHDNTAKKEQKLKKRLLVHQNILAHDVYHRARPTGSQRPRIYVLPKAHQKISHLGPSYRSLALPNTNLLNVSRSFSTGPKIILLPLRKRFLHIC